MEESSKKVHYVSSRSFAQLIYFFISFNIDSPYIWPCQVAGLFYLRHLPERRVMEKDERKNEIKEIPIELIDPFHSNPYKVKDDEDMEHLVESVRANGVLVPCIVRPKKDGRFELVAGHRRKRACELNFIPTLKCEVRELSKEEAIILMVESNFQRSELLPSEKAFAYKMRLDAMKMLISRMVENKNHGRNYGGKPVEPQLKSAREHLANSYGVAPEDVNKIGTADSRKHEHSVVGQLGPHGRLRDEIAQQTGESSRQVFRYIRLTELIPELLQLVDEKKIALTPAVELSYLGIRQKDVYEIISREELTPSYSQALRMKKLCLEGNLNRDAVEAILLEEKPNQTERISLRADKFAHLFPKNLPSYRREEYMLEAMEHYARFLQRKARDYER